MARFGISNIHVIAGYFAGLALGLMAPHAAKGVSEFLFPPEGRVQMCLMNGGVAADFAAITAYGSEVYGSMCCASGLDCVVAVEEVMAE